jgi:hypothetical protein
LRDAETTLRGDILHKGASRPPRSPFGRFVCKTEGTE